MQKKIKNVLEELPYEKLIDVYNKVLKAWTEHNETVNLTFLFVLMVRLQSN